MSTMVCSFGSAVGSELPVGHERDSVFRSYFIMFCLSVMLNNK